LIKSCSVSVNAAITVSTASSPTFCAILLIPFARKYGRGVCGTSWKGNKTIIVPNVDEFPHQKL